MEFASDTHRAAYESVKAITSKYADFGELDGAPGFALATRSARVFIVILPWAENRSVMQIRAYLIADFEKSYELADHLLSLNSQVVLGAWGWEGDRIFYQYTVVADEMTEESFDASMNAVVASVEGLGPNIVETWALPDENAGTPDGEVAGDFAAGSDCACGDSCECTDDGCGCDTPEGQELPDA
ncbi:MAG: T3SS (YopN, CesT) and YbjN peptide-binding chaperone 1 [Coriobacteriia bacterium]